MLDDYLIAKRFPGRITFNTIALHIDRSNNLVRDFTSTNIEEGIIEGGGFDTMSHIGAHLILPTKPSPRNDVEGGDIFSYSYNIVLGR